MRLPRHVHRFGLIIGLFAAAASAVVAQAPARRVATVAALKQFAAFYHGKPVLVRGELKLAGDRTNLVTAEDTIPLLVQEGTPNEGTYDVRGEALDIGRLTPGDPRLGGMDLTRLGIDPAERWPSQGQVVVVRATRFDKAEPPRAPSIRAIALDPQRYEGQRVTVAGEFRGRNLYGDLPQAPADAAESRWEFVIRSADAAIWVLGKRPRGRGFEFDVNSRIDTRRWLEVAGIVRHARGLAWMQADELREVEPQREAAPPEQPTAALPPVPPEVLFSAPADGETDVPIEARVRIQFSRDIEPDTLKGRLRASYLGGESVERGEPQAPVIETSFKYDPGVRVVEIAFARPLERFRTIRVELLDGITGTDGAPLKAWTLTFSVGG
jgi:hypothetical protein